jgi:glycosyltransferase involved in cell wall biosynthesis
MVEAAPRISVVMPVFNRERTVGRSVGSVLKQHFTDFELLIVDDGSTDATVEAVRAFCDPRIVLIRQPRNLGGNAARNRGILQARGDIVSFLDSDDVFLPHKLAYVDRFLADHGDVEALIDSFEVVAADTRRATRRNPVLVGTREVEQAIFARRVYKATPALSARRDALLRVGLFDETLRRRQDMDLVLRLARHSRCATTDAVLWRKHWSRDGISAQQETFMQAMIDICDRHPEYLSNWSYKPGLARDFARHFLRLAWHGRFAVVARDLRHFVTVKSRAHAVELLALGMMENLRRLLAGAATRRDDWNTRSAARDYRG